MASYPEARKPRLLIISPAFAYDGTPPLKADETNGGTADDGDDSIVEAVRGCWADGVNWNRLSLSGHKAISKILSSF